MRFFVKMPKDLKFDSFQTGNWEKKCPPRSTSDCFIVWYCLLWFNMKQQGRRGRVQSSGRSLVGHTVVMSFSEPDLNRRIFFFRLWEAFILTKAFA